MPRYLSPQPGRWLLLGQAEGRPASAPAWANRIFLIFPRECGTGRARPLAP